MCSGATSARSPARSPCSTRWTRPDMELSLSDGGTLYYELHGDHGSWLVCLNGAMATTATWSPICALASRHHRVILVDFRDQGRSSRLAQGYRADRHCVDLIAI